MTIKNTVVLLSLGYLGYTLYNKYGKGNAQVDNFVDNASRKIKDTFNNLSSSLNPGANNASMGLDIDPRIQAQMNRGEGLTDEAKVGIND